ncbi:MULTISPECIES: nuclear transport factor 2 family protein [unclassified Streptomyces]|uniref:nuclear transport factor 2 family protein n=1 Tax=unclassified Streptomyces TaxID=2593676 RepID=UPI0007093BFA|nr:nuclear transport factor 2 family protein [Streptomyces sp. Root369]KQV94137.1 hypothetical protein ASD08_13890 [Streptomyces sp. Root369]
MSYLDIEAIKVLKARYFRYVDTKDWKSWRELFTEDARINIDGTDRTADEFLEFTSQALEGTFTVHHGYMPEIELMGDSTARGIWAMHDWAVFANGSVMRGWGHYHESYRRVGDEWRINELTLTRLRVDQATTDLSSAPTSIRPS